ncbi:MAG: DUF1684 domain-containing protein [Propionibacteriaceae bacterium]|nr:DUF1684 domain-containing protein [Propionibacteriaceae bacterium]
MSGTDATNTNRLEAFRVRKNEFFKAEPDSPLTPEQQERFTALAYFPPNPDLTLELPLDTSGDGVGEVLTIGTTDGKAKPFERAGCIQFEAGGQPVTLTVFKEHGRGRYYLPFRDATAGVETYAVGRYLDIRARPNGDLLVDFNYAYNPYCAYGDGWSCPIPPRENVISARIEAGERAFADRAELEL